MTPAETEQQRLDLAELEQAAERARTARWNWWRTPRPGRTGWLLLADSLRAFNRIGRKS